MFAGIVTVRPSESVNSTVAWSDAAAELAEAEAELALAEVLEAEALAELAEALEAEALAELADPPHAARPNAATQQSATTKTASIFPFEIKLLLLIESPLSFTRLFWVNIILLHIYSYPFISFHHFRVMKRALSPP